VGRYALRGDHYGTSGIWICKKYGCIARCSGIALMAHLVTGTSPYLSQR